MATQYEPGLRVSEYLLEDRLGAGSFCEVWKARHHIWESEHVAIKLPIDPEYVRYLQREGLVVHGIRHPNVVRVLGLDPYAETPYLVMELVRGPSLGALLSENPKGLPIEAALTMTRGVLSALVAAHSAGVLHRDIKPGNILLNLAGRGLAELKVDDVKVVDFGLGLKATDSLRSIAQSASLERDNKLVGTLAYMAPEVRNNDRQPDARSDLYSVGVVLFEMLTGERPAGAELPNSMRSECPAWLNGVFQSLYARWERRFESAAHALEAVCAGGRLGGARKPPPVPSSVAPASLSYTRPPSAEAGTDVPCPRCRVSLAAHSGLTHCPVCNADLDPADFAVRPGAAGLPRVRTTQPARGASCEKCGSQTEFGDQFCTQCGAQLVESIRRCGTCGFWPAPEDAFCTSCGAGLPAAR